MPSTAYRLPTTVRPRRYDIALDARLDAPEFTGQVAIRLEVTSPVPAIELHARDLTLQRASLAWAGRRLDGTIRLDPADHVARIEFPEVLPAGEAVLTIAYRGRISLGLEGLYRATDGPEELICSQCEATAARRIFPCFDEPAFKAQFAYEITTAPGATVLTNTPLLASRLSGDGQSQVWRFAASPPMSTYLVGLAIGDIAATPAVVANGTPLRIWALRGKEGLGRFAQDYTARLLPWFEDYFAFPYHFMKYDQVAVPGFAAGAMENSGLVLFRQTLLLLNPRTVSWRQEKAIASVIAHEFAHQWFGNLVTMAWWDDLWLNEAFADWMSYRVVDALDPQYAIWLDFQRGVTAALAVDALLATHPIYSPVATAAEAEEMFDTITYVKGCGVLRMLENFLGAEAFRVGIRAYVAEFAERNACGGDLWRHLAAATAAPVTAIMESWITQAGYPVLHLTRIGSGISSRLRIRQERFFARPGVAEPGTLWQVPAVIRYADSAGVHELCPLLVEATTDWALPVRGELAWCYANAGQAGFYRLDPDPPLLAGLLAHLPELSPAEQIGLLDDQWALVQNGAGALDPILELLARLARSDDYPVLQQVVAYLHTLDDLLDLGGDVPAGRGFRTWVAQLFEPRLSGLGFAARPGDLPLVAQVRTAVVEALSTIARTPAALAAARDAAEREATDAAAVDPNLISVFLIAAAREGDGPLFDRYLSVYRQRKATGAAPQETDRYLYSFPSFAAPALVARTLALLESGVFPRESLSPLLGRMLAHPPAQHAAWDYVKAHWPALSALNALTAPVLVAACGGLPASLRADVVAFFDTHLQGMAPLTYARALETLDQQADLQARLRGALSARFGPTDR